MAEITYQSPTERVETWLDETTLHIRFNNPARHNALSVEMWEAIPALLAFAEQDERVRLVVFSGAGEKAFVSGADISQFEDMRAAREAVARYEVIAEAALMGIYHFSKPTLACIRGYCVGGGNEIHLFSDLSIASEDAQFGQTGPRVGSIPIWGACQLLARYVGERKAREMVFGCRLYSAQQALEMGLINEVWKPEALDKAVDDWCQDILNKSPQSIRIAKLALNAGSDQEFYPSFFPAGALLASIYGNDENMEGIRAFLEKRKPDFRGFRRKGS